MGGFRGKGVLEKERNARILKKKKIDAKWVDNEVG
jgi:hypothetical protein